jgi:uncharacterized protein (TIGR02453 family)
MVCKSKNPSPAPAAAAFFRPEALKFLRSLARHNDREWFQPRKAVYEAELKEPMLALVRKVNDAMLAFAPDYVRPAEKSLFRIYRDTRFSSDKAPYKRHVAAWWARHGLEKTSGAGYYFHIEPKEVIIAAGAWMPEKEQLRLIRLWLLDHHTEFRALLKKPAIRKMYAEFEGNPLVRAPKGFDPEHPAMDLVKCRQWGLSVSLPPETAFDPKLAALVTRYFKLAAPVVDALNAPLVAAVAPKRKVLVEGVGRPGLREKWAKIGQF